MSCTTAYRGLGLLVCWLGFAMIASGLGHVVSADTSESASSGDKSGQVVANASDSAPSAKPASETVSLTGRVVWLGEALVRHGVPQDDDALQTQTALETSSGELIPLVKDARGRAFWKDARLRDIDMELVVKRVVGIPVVQVIQTYTLHDNAKFELDYWCDICAIPMYELKQCECCQGEIRLRERKVDASGRTE